MRTSVRCVVLIKVDVLCNQSKTISSSGKSSSGKFLTSGGFEL